MGKELLPQRRFGEIKGSMDAECKNRCPFTVNVEQTLRGESRRKQAKGMG